MIYNCNLYSWWGFVNINAKEKHIFYEHRFSVALDEVFAGNIFSSYAAELFRMDLT